MKAGAKDDNLIPDIECACCGRHARDLEPFEGSPYSYHLFEKNWRPALPPDPKVEAICRNMGPWQTWPNGMARKMPRSLWTPWTCQSVSERRWSAVIVSTWRMMISSGWHGNDFIRENPTRNPFSRPWESRNKPLGSKKEPGWDSGHLPISPWAEMRANREVR